MQPYRDGFNDGENWQKEKDKQTIDKLIEVIKMFVGSENLIYLSMPEWKKFDEAKELINQLEKNI